MMRAKKIHVLDHGYEVFLCTLCGIRILPTTRGVQLSDQRQKPTCKRCIAARDKK